MGLRHLKRLKISYAIVIRATTGPEAGEAQGDSKPQSPFSAMLQAATRCVWCLYVWMQWVCISFVLSLTSLSPTLNPI